MTLDHVLLARALRDPYLARALVRHLQLDRRPTGAADCLRVKLWRSLCPLLASYHGDLVAFLDGAAAYHTFVFTAHTLPEWFLARAEPTGALLATWNAGQAGAWSLPKVSFVAGETRKDAA